MNRRQRRDRQRRKGTRPAPPGMAAVIGCPDCDSDVTVTEVAPGVYQGQVAHDDSCPWLADLKARGGNGVRYR